MSESLSQVLYANALRLLYMERRRHRDVDKVYRMYARRNMKAGLEEWLYNPFIKTALSILKRFSSNYRIKEAIKLLEAAGEEAEKAARPGRKARQ